MRITKKRMKKLRYKVKNSKSPKVAHAVARTNPSCFERMFRNPATHAAALYEITQPPDVLKSATDSTDGHIVARKRISETRKWKIKDFVLWLKICRKQTTYLQWIYFVQNQIDNVVCIQSIHHIIQPQSSCIFADAEMQPTPWRNEDVVQTCDGPMSVFLIQVNDVAEATVAARMVHHQSKLHYDSDSFEQRNEIIFVHGVRNAFDVDLVQDNSFCVIVMATNLKFNFS